MSGELQRALGVMKGYVNREWERITAVEKMDAVTELDTAFSSRPTTRAEEPALVVRDAAHARRILDVAEGSTYEEIKAAYDKLHELSKPDQFPAGTQEHSRAVRVQRSIHTAYRVLIEEFSTTEKRFKSLEID